MLTVVVCVLVACVPLSAQEPDPKLLESIAVLRKINIEKLSDQKQQEKAKQIDEAWEYLNEAGEPAIALLKEEIAKVDAAQEKDNFFKLNATVVIWNIGKAKEAGYIGDVWTSTPVREQYNYVFYTAFEAAQTQDPKVLPMLRAVLKDDKGAIFVGGHSMNVPWPLSHEFIWGVYGPSALPVLLEVLERSANEIEIKSATKLLTRAHYLPALPKIRLLAADPRQDVRGSAIEALGTFGHPSDYDLLINGLRSTDTKELFSYAFALYEFDDERAVPHLIPLLQKKDDALFLEASLALLHLLTPESFAAVRSAVAKYPNAEVKEYLQQAIDQRKNKLPKNFDRLTQAQQRPLLEQLRNAGLKPKSDGSPLTHKQLIDALNTWKSKGRIDRSGVDWTGVASIISAATADDIELIQQTKAAFYRRLSDECLYEVRDLDTAVKHIGRGRYRKGLGVVEKAESK